MFKILNYKLHRYFQTLSNEVRFEIFILITELSENYNKGEGDNYGSKISEILNLNQPTVANHVKELKNSDLIYEKKIKRRVYLFPSKEAQKHLHKFGQYFLKKREWVENQNEHINKAGILDLIIDVGKSKHSVELYFYYEKETVYLLAQVHKGNEYTNWIKYLKENKPSYINIAGKEFTVLESSLKSDEKLENSIRRLFREKYGDDQYQLWFKDTARLPVQLKVKEK